MKIETILSTFMLFLSSLVTVSVVVVPSVAGVAVEVTGNFTSTGTVSAVVWNTTLDFGNISTGGHLVLENQVNNTGSTVIDVTHDQVVEDSGADLTIGTMGSLSADEYSVLMNSTIGSGSWTDIGNNDNSVVADDLAVSGNDEYNLCVNLSSSVTKQYPAEETFSADLTVSEGGS